MTTTQFGAHPTGTDAADHTEHDARGDGLLALIAGRRAGAGRRSFLSSARGRTVLSFDDLWGEVGRWGRWLDHHGAVPGDRIGIVIADPVEFATVYLCIVANGRWAVPVDPTAPADSVHASLARTKPVLVISDRNGGRTASVPWHRLDDPVTRRDPAGRPDGTGTSPGPPAGGGVLLSTSGSTGHPKLVVLHQHQLLHTARAVARHHRLGPDDIGFNPLPLFHVNAQVVGMLASLWAGAGLVLDDRFHRTGFWELMDRHQVTWINAVPAIISHLTGPGPTERVPGRIRFIRSASAPLPVATLERFEASTGITVLETYGMTESASQITANPLDGRRKPGSVGLPVDISVRVVVEHGDDGTDTLAAAGETGRVEIRGPSVDPRAGVPIGEGPGGNAGRIGGWLRTGDIGCLDEDGYLYLQGRRDDVINRGGEKVFPREIEDVILQDPRVVDAVVVGAADQALGQVPVAYFTVAGPVGRPGTGRGLGIAVDVRERLGRTLPRSRRPVALHLVPGLPVTATGKVSRRMVGGDGTDTIVTLDVR
jgi:acyl-CoA synthetase (AMP-forming)/AMP-acid ligase II